MANLDATSLARLILDLGLAPAEQVEECRAELSVADPAELLQALERKGALTPWQSQKLLKGEQTGYILGNYRLLYKIASGTFGRVFRADDLSSGTVVAVKVLRRRWSNDQRGIDLFAREAKVGLSLKHPNIVSILAMERDIPSEQHYIAMEFVEGGSLRDFMNIRKKLEPAEALRILEEAVSGLAYAHSRGVNHRDLKLTNILISSQGAAKLVDFGLAAVSSSSSGEDEKVDHTVDYVGLERATGVQPGDVRSDIYFMGCIFYEMLSGQPPLDMTRDRQVRMQKQRFENVQQLTRTDVDAPPIVFKLLETMMALDPQRRYQEPEQALEAIRMARRMVAKGDRPSAAATTVERSIFVVEKDQRLQDVFREKLAAAGYRVLLSFDPSTAFTRFRQKPYDALVVDAGSTGEEGMEHFEKILTDARRQRKNCAGILILSEEQAGWGEKVRSWPKVAVLVRPLTLRQLTEKLNELVPLRKEC